MEHRHVLCVAEQQGLQAVDWAWRPQYNGLFFKSDLTQCDLFLWVWCPSYKMEHHHLLCVAGQQGLQAVDWAWRPNIMACSLSPILVSVIYFCGFGAHHTSRSTGTFCVLQDNRVYRWWIGRRGPKIMACSLSPILVSVIYFCGFG